MAKRVVNRVEELLAIKKRVENRDINKKDFAEELGVTRPTIDKYLNNDVKRYDESILLALCAYFGCSIGELLLVQEYNDDPDSGQMKSALLATA